MSETQNSLPGLKSQVQIRTATETDVPFIFNSWLKSFRPTLSTVSAPIYFDAQHKLIEAILLRSTVLVACNKEDTNQLYGYVVVEKIEQVDVVHYAYIKQPFRKMGLLHIMLSEAGLSLQNSAFYTHETISGSRLLKKVNSKLIYNPYLAHGPKV